MAKFNVGDEVVVEGRSYHRGPPSVETYTIARVARKYFYVKDRYQERGFDLETGIEKHDPNYPQYADRAYTPDGFLAKERRNLLLDRIKEHGILWDHGGPERKLSLDTLEKLVAVLDADGTGEH